MKLWTWQNPKLDITDPNMRVDSKKYSNCLCSILNSAAKQHLKKYEKLWSILGTDQFHWCYTNREEATDNRALEYYKGSNLWEIDVPEDKVFKKICSMAWHWILKNCDALPPTAFEQLVDTFFWPDRNTFSKDYNQYWRNMSSKQLWDSLFYNCDAKGCYDVLVCHPVVGTWVNKDPRKEINWWQK